MRKLSFAALGLIAIFFRSISHVQAQFTPAISSILSRMLSGFHAYKPWQRQHWVLSPLWGGVLLCGAWLACLPTPSALAATLTHRYSFDTDARDSIGGADGMLKGVAVIQQGAVVFDGTNSGVQLPADLLTNYNSLSCELWFVDETAGRRSYSLQGSTLFYFGTSKYFLSFSNLLQAPDANYGMVAYYNSLSRQTVYCSVPPVGRTNHLVWTQDAASQTACIYLNGILASRQADFTATPASLGSATNDWLGSNGSAFNLFAGRILEFRIYDGAVSAEDVAFHEAAGPDLPDPNPGPLQQIRIEVPSEVGLGSATAPVVRGDYAALTNVNLLGQPTLRLASDTPQILSVTTVSNFLAMPMLRPAMLLLGTTVSKIRTETLGVGRLTAEFGGCTASADISVRNNDQVSLIHRYTFNEPTGSAVLNDEVGNASGRVYAGSFTGKGELVLNDGCVVLPPGMLSGLGEISIEGWVTWTGYSPWQMIFDFGDQVVYDGGSQTSGRSYILMTPLAGYSTTGYRSTITTNGIGGEFPFLDLHAPLPRNVTSQVAITYSFPHHAAALFLNGRLVASDRAIFPLGGINDVVNMLGGSLFTQDPGFLGRFNELRIYNGWLHPAELASSYQAGMDSPLQASSGFQMSTLAPDPLEPYRAGLRALVRRDSVPTSVFFQYGITTNLDITTDVVDVGTGVDQVEASVLVTNLSKLTAYYVRAATIRDGTTNFGTTLTFNTTNDIVTLPASNISVGSAQLNGFVAPNGQPVSVSFEYWRSGYTNTTPPIIVNGGQEFVPFEVDVDNLLPGTYHYYRAVISNPAGLRYANTQYFRTAPPIQIQSASRQGSEVRISFNGLEGISYALMGSPDLVTWTELTNATPDFTGTFSLSDYDAAGNDVRFYRIRTP